MFEDFQATIGYRFSNDALLETAFTHSSFKNERGLQRDCNERLEFLGDSVLGMISADYFYHNLSHLPEGEMTKRRAACVCEKSLFEFAQEIDLGKYILLGRGEERRMAAGEARRLGAPGAEPARPSSLTRLRP